MAGESGDSPSQLIDAKIRGMGDWRGETLARLRALIRAADPVGSPGTELEFAL